MNAAFDEPVTITSASHPDIHASDLLKALQSGGFLYVEIEGFGGPWAVVAVTPGHPWTAKMRRVVDDGGPRGPTTEPRRRRG